MAQDVEDRLIAAIQDGLPIVPRPYSVIARQVGLGETEVIERIQRLIEDGTISRFGVVVRHRPLGFCANAMVVWDVPDDAVDAVGKQFASNPEVTLCYRRPRRPPAWPYNLFCMVHGKDRARVLDNVDQLARSCDAQASYAVLFSTRAFKQRGAHYVSMHGKIDDAVATADG
ncbi:MAG TPA: AsnC family transcriptional regulator [Gammaproteobacteria bacterium]|nr:AsnC family transcriptional regulator [Gammaproteobacteria bacterium]